MTSAGPFTSAGSTLGISATLPTTFDSNQSTGYPSLTFTNIGNLENLGEFGPVWGEATFTPLDSRVVQKFKTSVNYGNMTLQAALDNTDNGQDLIFAAENSDNSYAFEVTLQNNDVYYFTGKVMSARVSVGAAEQVTMVTIDVSIDRDTILVAATTS